MLRTGATIFIIVPLCVIICFILIILENVKLMKNKEVMYMYLDSIAFILPVSLCLVAILIYGVYKIEKRNREKRPIYIENLNEWKRVNRDVSE